MKRGIWIIGLLLLASAVFAAIPTHTQPVLNSTTGANTTDENLTLFNQSTFDSDGDLVKNVHNWLVNGSPLAVLNLPFEANGGNEATSSKDYSGLGNNVTTVVAAVFRGDEGVDGFGVYNFSSAYLQIPHDSSLTFTDTGFTLAAWIFPRTPGTGIQDIITKRGGGLEPATTYSMGIFSDSTFRFFDARLSSAFPTPLTNITLSANRWYHVAAVWTEDNVKLYVNGSKHYDDNNGGRSGSLPQNTGPVDIGDLYHNGGHLQFFDGLIDEVLIINRSLSSAEIQVLAQNRTDLIVAEETALGDDWKGCITPNDKTSDGNELCSDNLTIISAPEPPPPEPPPIPEFGTLGWILGLLLIITVEAVFLIRKHK